MNFWDWSGVTFSFLWLFSRESVFSFFGVRLFVGYFSGVIVSMFLVVLGGLAICQLPSRILLGGSDHVQNSLRRRSCIPPVGFRAS